MIRMPARSSSPRHRRWLSSMVGHQSVMTAVMLLLGNVIFFLLDRVLSKRFRR